MTPKEKKHTIFFAAGGTGGHIFPALAIAKLFLDKYNVIWIGASKGLENEIIPKNNIQLLTIKISGVRKKGLAKMLMVPFQLSLAFLQALFLILKYRPCRIVGFGGYATFPICIMGRLLMVPILIHEQNAVPGLSNRILAKFANSVMVAFPNVLDSKKTCLVGNPVRQEILAIPSIESRYNKRSGGLKVLVLGGSLGAKVFNDFMPQVFAQTKNIGEITHQIGRGDKNEVDGLYKKYQIKASVVNFIDDMANMYANIDLIICRAGASTVSEVANVGLAAIFVPFLHAVDDHQYYNAKSLADVGGAMIVRQQDLTVDKMVTIISELDRSKCQEMAIKGKSIAKPNSNRDIYNLISQGF